MPSGGGILCRFAIIDHQKLQNVLFRSIDHCSFCCLCCWVRCWMLQDMHNMEASCVIYAKVGTFTHPEQSKIPLLTVNKMGIVRLTVQLGLIVSISLMWYPGDYLRPRSADVLSLKQCPIHSWQSCNFCCRRPQFITANKQTTLYRLIAHLGAVRNPCNLQRCPAGFIFSIMNMLAAMYSILTCG